MKNSLHLVLLFILTACASGHHMTATKMRQLLAEGNHEEAIRILEESALAKDTKSKLLYKIEKGLLAHYQADFETSIQALNEAKILLDELYTTRISGKLASSLTNDNADIYYGEKYEASMVYFYLALNYYLQAEQEINPEQSKVLSLKARSEILAWDSFLTEMKIDRAGKAVFKEDLLAKTFGALVHESQQNQNDKQVALQLYQDAREILFKHYNLYPTFNSAYQVFKEQYENLPTMSRANIEKNYVQPTQHNAPLQEFLTFKILSLTKKLRPQDFKNQVALLKPSAELLKKVSYPGSQVTFLVQDGLIAEKLAKQYQFPIQLGATAGFAATLGYGGPITYELPYVAPVPTLELATLQALDQKGNVISESSLSVVAPLGEMAEQAVNEHSTAIAAKTGARVAAKHLAALVISYAAYQSMSQKQPAMAQFTAILGHAAAVAAINESEKADTRFWSTLPSNVRMGSMILPKGTYRFQALINQRVIDLGEQTVENNTMKFVMNKKTQTVKARSIAGK